MKLISFRFDRFGVQKIWNLSFSFVLRDDDFFRSFENSGQDLKTFIRKNYELFDSALYELGLFHEHYESSWDEFLQKQRAQKMLRLDDIESCLLIEE